MRGHSGGGDDHFEAIARRRGGELLDLRGRTVGGHNLDFVLDSKISEGIDAWLEDRQVGLGARQDRYASHWDWEL